MCAESASSRRRPWYVAAILAALFLSSGAAALAAIPPDIPLTLRPPTGVRASGMAGTYVALADDYEALLHNPGGLARVARTEISGSVERRAHESEATYLGSTGTAKMTKTKIHALGFAYPFPVYRGSIVVGFSFDRVTPIDGEYYRSGSGAGIANEEESILEEGGVGAWTSGIAFDLSPTLSLGASGTILSGSSRRERTFHYRASGGPDRETTMSTTDMDIDAVTGTFGALLRPARSVRAGVVLHLPESYTLKGRITEDTQRYQDLGTIVDTLDYIDEYRFDDEVKLPLRASLGLAISPEGSLAGLTVCGQVDIADWTQIDYAGPIRTAGREYAYRSVTELRGGIEYARDISFGGGTPLPLRLRGGFASIPIPYRLIGTDVFLGEARPARFLSDRTLVSAGVGLGIDPNTMIDAAWTHTSFERSGQSDAGRVTSERVSENSFLAGITFRI